MKHGAIVLKGREQLFDVLNTDNDLLYRGLAYDHQCGMYYWPESNGFITDDQVKSNQWTVIESGYYE